jgi:hypothetical protein
VQVFVPETNKADYAASTSLVAILGAFLSGVHASDYFGINAYLPRNRQVGNLLRRLRLAVRRQTNAATTIGFGPRFLHSTGQLHKGGPASGIFLQITATPDLNLPIPGQDITFGTLEMAQALGDFESLAARGRRVLRLHLPSPRALRDIVLIVESHAAHR